VRAGLFGQNTREHVDLVQVGDRYDQRRVGYAGSLQNTQRRAVPVNSHHIQVALDFAKSSGCSVDYNYVSILLA
jgi:hypothetical protein